MEYRFATAEDTSLILWFIKELAEYEKMLDEVVADEDTVYIIKLTGSFLLKIPQLFSWLPAPALALIVSIFTVVVIYKVMGREG